MIQIDYSQNIMLEAEVKQIDASFDHAFGVKEQTDIEIIGLKIFYVFNEKTRDITDYVLRNDAEFYNELEDFFYSKALEKNL